MLKRSIYFVMSFILSVVFLFGTATTIKAQDQTSDGIVSLAQLGQSEIFLDGPFQATTFSFGIPAEWKFNGNAKVVVRINVNFNTDPLLAGVSNSGGKLMVGLNRQTIATFILTEVGNFEYEIPIPADVLVSPRQDGLMELKFTLQSGISCQVNQRMTVIIDPSTHVDFPHEIQKPDTSLARFPFPIIQSTIVPDSALVVIPDSPTALELQSAYTVIAGLGNLSGSNLGIDLVQAGQLLDEQKSATHLIYVGKLAGLPDVAGFELPLAAVDGKFSTEQGQPDDGFIQMINSPWAANKVILVVSGNTDAGVLKGAQAVSTGFIQSNTSPNLAVVNAIQDSELKSLRVDQTLADLGYDTKEFNSRGAASAAFGFRGVESSFYSFYMPAGNLLTDGAYFDLAYGHSALMNFNTSGMVVLLNGQPIGSVKFEEATASQPVNVTRIALPSGLVGPGNNRIEVRTSLDPLDQCTDPNLNSLYAIVWPESILHLPYGPSDQNIQLPVDLSSYPAPVVFDSTLESTAVILDAGDLSTIRNFAKVANYLGDRSNGPITKLNVFFDDELSGVNLSGYHILVAGQTGNLDGVLSQVNSGLPVPFDAEGNLTESNFFQVNYQIPPNAPIGYIELITSPWNSSRTVLLALASTEQGVSNSLTALVDSTLISQLSGDFAMIDGARVKSIDTRLSLPSAAPAQPANTGSIATPLPAASETAAAPAVDRPNWLLPTMIFVIALIVILIGFAVFANLRNSR